MRCTRARRRVRINSFVSKPGSARAPCPHLREKQMKTTRLQFVQRLALAAVVAMMVACAWLAPLDFAANQEVDAGLKRALISFASARGLNAIISAVQGTELAVEPAGIGVVFTPGQVLDPVNDLAEQFSNLMLLASVSFGIQKVFLSIGAYWVISMLLSLAALAWAFFYLRMRPVSGWLTRILVVLLMIRFAVPVAVIGTEKLFQKFMAADYSASQQAIDTTSGQLVQLNPPVDSTREDQGMLEKLKGWWSQNGDVKVRFEQLKQAAERATENIIKLIVIFLLQTLVIPLLLLWVLYGVTRRAFQAAD